MSRYRVIFYCPDRHIKLRGDLPDTSGLGGGKTAIIKMAQALHAKGCNVTVYSYCEPGIYNGVEYRSYEQVSNASCDIFIATSGGDKLDLSHVPELQIKAKLKIAWLSGTNPIRGVDIPIYDYYYVYSVFLKQKAVEKWKLPLEKILATRNGIDPSDFPEDNSIQRNLLKFVFASHPSKGLSRTLEIIERLRKEQRRDFKLDLFGGYSLWGGTANTGEFMNGKEWINDLGMVSQPDLCRHLFSYNFMLHSTEYEDTTSIILQQAKRAGVIVIASDVGGNSEIIKDGFDGFIIRHHYLSEECYKEVFSIVDKIIKDSEYSTYIRTNAMSNFVTWEDIAEQWLEHWDTSLLGKHNETIILDGYYGFKNLGDEAILGSIIKRMDENHRRKIAVISHNPYYTEKHHKVRAIKRGDIQNYVTEISRSRCVILGGGGLFQDHHEIKISNFFTDPARGITSYATSPLIAKIMEKPLFFLYHGVGPIFTMEAKLFTKWAFSLPDHISVRDKYSLYLLTKILEISCEKISLTLDPTLYEKAPPKMRAISLMLHNDIDPDDKEYVIVAPRFWIKESIQQRTVKELQFALLSLIDDGFFIILIPFHILEEEQHNDLHICRVVGDVLPEHSYRIIENYNEWEEILALYRWAKISIGMRYHSLIASAVANIPVIAISYDKKTDEFMRDLRMEKYSHSLESFTAKEILNSFYDIKANYEEIRNKIAATLQSLIEERPDDKTLLEIFSQQSSEQPHQSA